MSFVVTIDFFDELQLKAPPYCSVALDENRIVMGPSSMETIPFAGCLSGSLTGGRDGGWFRFLAMAAAGMVITAYEFSIPANPHDAPVP